MRIPALPIRRPFTLQEAVPFSFNGHAELLGQESVNGTDAWHVRLVLASAKRHKVGYHYWISTADGFKVHRMDFLGTITVTSVYDPEVFPWLPTLTTIYEYSPSDPMHRQTPIRETEIHLLEAQENVRIPSQRWTLAGMNVAPGSSIQDDDLMIVTGHWDGRQVVPIENPAEGILGRRNLVAVLVVVLALIPVLYVALRRMHQ